MSVIEAPQTTTPATTRNILYRAVDLLEEFGWCQKDMGSKIDGAFCIGGAIHEAYCELSGEKAVVVAWRANESGELDVASILGMFDVPGWNDKPGRTKAEVIAKLRETAEASA